MLTRRSIAPSHGLPSLQAPDGDAAILVLQAVPPGWTLDRHQGVEGELMLMITPPGDEHTTPTFVLSDTLAGIELAVALGDSCDTLGTFADVRQAVAHARQIMMTSTADMQVVA